MLQSTNGGSSETEVKELQVSPAGSSELSLVVIMATPVGKTPIARRYSFVSNGSARVDSLLCSRVGVVACVTFSPLLIICHLGDLGHATPSVGLKPSALLVWCSQYQADK
jgi:hypothetical protein